MRRTNPRDALGWEGRLTARHRILRRGMPYGPALPDGAADDGAARGLLFVCLQASIARQFEIVQTQWCNDGNAFGLGREADPITRPGRRRGAPHHRGRPAARGVAPLRSYVECRGGEYLVVPVDQRAARAAGAVAQLSRRRPRANAERSHGTAWNTVPRQVTPSGQTHPWSQMP